MLFRRKVKKTPANPKGRCTNDARMLSVEAKQCHWAAILQEVKRRWSEAEVQEQAWLLAAYHNVGSMRVPRWVKDVYTYMERYGLTGEHVYCCTHNILEQQGIFWEPNSNTEDSNEESTGGSSSDSSGTGSTSDRLEDE